MTTAVSAVSIRNLDSIFTLFLLSWLVAHECRDKMRGSSSMKNVSAYEAKLPFLTKKKYIKKRRIKQTAIRGQILYVECVTSIKYCCCNFSNFAELRYLQYLVIVMNSIPNMTCLHPKDLQYVAAPASEVGNYRNSKSLTDSGKKKINIQICPNLTREEKKRLDYCFSRLHLFLHCGIFFLYIYIKCTFFDVQGFQSCQICIALLNVLIIIVLCERPRPLLLIVSSSLFFCSNESQLWLSEASCPLWTAAATSIPFSPMMLARDGCQQTVWFLV